MFVADFYLVHISQDLSIVFFYENEATQNFNLPTEGIF